MNVSFYIQFLYYLPQFSPVINELNNRGYKTEVVINRNVISENQARAIEAELPGSKFSVDGIEDVVCHYQSTKPDWVIFGNVFEEIDKLPSGIKTAMIYHGIGVKDCYYNPYLLQTDVRFVEGEHRTKEILRRNPEARLKEVGFSKLDPLFQKNTLDRSALFKKYGLDQDKKTILYAPTFYPSSLELMSKAFPAEFSEYNIIIKAHEFSLTKSKYKNQRKRLKRWQQYNNVYLAQDTDYSLVPFMAISDILISEASSALFEFAALDKPVVWCDFLKLRWNYRGIFRHRFERRMDQSLSQYKDIALHVKKYKDLKGAVDAETSNPSTFSQKRLKYSADLLGNCDGKVSERIIDYLLETTS